MSSFVAYLEVVRAGRIHTIYAFHFLAIHFLIWETSFYDWDFFHQNWEKCILVGIGNGSFYGTRTYRQKNPCLHFESGINDIYDSTSKFILKPFCPQ